MKPIYQVRYSGEPTGHFFSTLNKAQKYAGRLMIHFGGGWKMALNDESKITYRSERIFQDGCCINYLYISISSIALNEEGEPRKRVNDAYTDEGGRTIYVLGK